MVKINHILTISAAVALLISPASSIKLADDDDYDFYKDNTSLDSKMSNLASEGGASSTTQLAAASSQVSRTNAAPGGSGAEEKQAGS